MKQIIPGLWEIDEIGPSVHAYLWEWSEGMTLIDTGFSKDAPKILDALADAGIAYHKIKRIIVTHMDLDHTGGLPKIKRATQAPIACHTVEKEFLEHPWRRYPAALFMRPIYWAFAALPANRPQPITPDELLIDGQKLPEGFTVVHTPGHTPGHISLLHKEKRFLITGDAISNRGNQLRKPIFLYTPDEKNALRSIWKIAKKHGNDFETVVFGHGPPILQNGGKRIQGFTSQIFATNI